jgi:uncharacterized protein with GYD domain
MRSVLMIVAVGLVGSGLGFGQEPATTAKQGRPASKLLFLIEVKYTDSSWAAMAQKPQNRRELLEAVIGKLSGAVENLWFSFGDCDAYAVVSLPDNVSAEALQIAGLAGAGFKSLKTTPLLTVDQVMEAAGKAGSLRNGSAYKTAHKALEP